MSYICLFVERQVDGVWQQQMTTNDRYKDPIPFWYLQSNILLFSLLAGVDGNFIPLQEPRGLPEDLSVGLKEQWETELKGYYPPFTPSFYLLPELLAAQDIEEEFSGYVDAKNYKAFKKNGKPDAWDIMPTKGVEVLPNDKMERILKIMNMWDGPPPYTHISWKGQYKDLGKTFWDTTLVKMQALDEDPNKVRCVFWFNR